MKKFIILFLVFLFGTVFYVSARTNSKTFPIKGKVINLATGQGVSGVTISGTGVPTSPAPITDSVGKFSFNIVSSNGLPVPFTITHPTVSGAGGVYASNGNVSNFWEIDYLDQMAGVSCRSENAFCTFGQVVRDKGSSSLYDFVVEPTVTCASASSTPAIIPSGFTASDPGVATDGASVLVAIRGNNDEGLWVNTSSNLARNKWKGWVNVGGQIKADAAPAPRALAKNKFGIFVTGADDKKYGILRDTSKSRTPFVEVPSGFSFIARNVIKPGNVKFQFSKTSDNEVQFNQCT